MDPLKTVVRVGNVLGNRPEVGLPLVTAGYDPRMEIICQLSQLDANFVRGYVDDGTGTTGVHPRAPGPIEEGVEHRVMKIEQVDVGGRPDCFRGRACPVENQSAPARLSRAQNRLDFLVRRQNALLCLERFGTPALSSHELARATRPKNAVHSVGHHLGRNLVTLDAHRLLDTSHHARTAFDRLSSA